MLDEAPVKVVPAPKPVPEVKPVVINVPKIDTSFRLGPKASPAAAPAPTPVAVPEPVPEPPKPKGEVIESSDTTARLAALSPTSKAQAVHPMVLL